MAGKKKAYQRFEELTRQATAPIAEDEQDLGSPAPEPLPVWLSPELRRALEQHAAAEGSTPSELVEVALRRYLGSGR
jgi:hypothetical protein